ncbi:MAG: RluA family pseudouridine synthase [Verrucomicrobiota bacterium]
MSEHHTFFVSAEWSGERLDRVLPEILRQEGVEVSRAALQGWIKNGDIVVEGKSVKPRHVVAAGQKIEVKIPEQTARVIEPEEIGLDVLYEDEDIIVVNKVEGMVVHPGSGNFTGTLVNALLHHCSGNLCPLAGEDRPGIVHRLDKDTSGCLVAAKSERAYRSLVEQFSDRETGKRYIAVSEGVPKDRSGTIINRIGRHPVNRQKMAVLDPPSGKEAITEFEVLESSPEDDWALVLCVIHTGRTHQIRVHLKESLRCPILGDPIYGSRSRQRVRVDRLMLHARELEFSHPARGEKMRFRAPIPDAFSPFIKSQSETI